MRSHSVRLLVASNGFRKGDGGAYPECHVAQYPLDMGKKKVSGVVL